ncbi:MAG TPA: glycoside hydrolase family 3 N-terminal domain-containing protein [Prolixibacteraceae bacterium]
MQKNNLIGLLLLLTLFFPLKSQSQINLDKLLNQPWVDSVFNSLTPDERIAQLIWIDVSGDENLQKQLQVAELVRRNNFGGLVFFEGTAVKQSQLINYYQSLARTPLMVAMDAEWGPGMRLDEIVPFPYNMTMGASSDDELVEKCAAAMAVQLKRLGVQISFGPVADINTEPLNPIIGMRSFGESRDRVIRKSLAYMKGLQENGIIAVAKHYPGHGDAKTDSHLSLPLLPYPRQRLDSMELFPFKRLSAEGIGGIMTAHMRVPALDPNGEGPSSLSNSAVEGVIRKEWNYKGLIITDAMNMGGASITKKPGSIDVQAIQAGNDVIEFPVNGEATLKAIKEAIQNKELSWDNINLKCRRVLAAKYYAGLNHPQPIRIAGLVADLNSVNAQFVTRQLVESALTLLENKNNLVPFHRLDTLRIAALSIGSSAITPFQKMLGNYTKVDYFNLSENLTGEELNTTLKKMAGYNLVISGIHSLYESKVRRTVKVGNLIHVAPQRPYGATENLENLLSGLSSLRNSVFVFFSNPYAISELKDFGHPAGMLIAYQNTTNSQELAAQLLFGGIGAHGKLPVSIGNRYHAGDGLTISNPIRLKYTLPEEVGLNSAKLNERIDSIVNNALAQKAFPGCNVFVAKDGKVIFQKAYGFHTYENRIPASLDDIYDLASVTKVSGALPAIMKLNEEGKYLLDEPFSTYWTDWKKGFLHPSNKSDITLRELLAHQSGLVPFIPFYKQSMNGKTLMRKWYSADSCEPYNLEVAPGLYLNSKFKNKVYRSIRKSPLKTRGKYVYSDLSVILTSEVVVNIAGMKFTDYLDQNFYNPLGATTMTYLPSRKFSNDQIVPTDYDAIYRKRLVHGSVHDESAAVFGGIAGNAGLFASANDLAKLVQMYIQFGTYGGKQYLKKSTIEEFNRVQYPQNNNRRGLGFDKPLIDNQKFDKANAYPCPGASPQSFGHSGYTGTFFWADPSDGLVYIFLSNRVYPTRDNNKISDLNVRTDILQELYDEIRAAAPKH